MKTLFRLLLIGMLIAGWAAVNPPVMCLADDTDPADVEPEEDIPAANPEKVKALAEQFGIPEATLETMRADGMGWGEIKLAVSLADKMSKAEDAAVTADQALTDILADRQAGMGWGEIAKANGFKLGEVAGKGQAKRDIEILPDTGIVDPVEPEGLSVRPEKPYKPEKIEKAERVDRPDRPEKPNKPEKPDKPDRGK